MLAKVDKIAFMQCLNNGARFNLYRCCEHTYKILDKLLKLPYNTLIKTSNNA